MKVIIDIESNSLTKPTKIWLVVLKDIDTNELHIFRNLTTDEKEKNKLLALSSSIDLWIGHNIIGYDCPILDDLIGLKIPVSQCCDTLILSKLKDYSRPGGHSIEQYGLEYQLPKIHFNDWTCWSPEMEMYCVRDVEINHRVYSSLESMYHGPDWRSSIELEQSFQLICNDLSNNGFAFNVRSANALLNKVTTELGVLDEKIRTAFPPRTVVVRTFTPKPTKFGTIHKASVPRALHGQLHLYEIGQTYPLTKEEVFNPASHKQLIEVLNEAGWKPEDKTQTHIDTERALNQAKRNGNALERITIRDKLDKLQITGWKINETNLASLPDTAPEGARLLARRILLEARRRTLTEWTDLVQDDGRIHGRFYGIGAWTHRMAHQRPNTANIPREYLEDGSIKLYGKEFRSLWVAPKNRLLVGVDAEGIQLRIFAHYINDLEFTKALVEGKKDDKTDPHSLNQRILGDVCKTRQAAKRFVFALLLGGGLGKLAAILQCSTDETKKALDRLLMRYEGFARLKKTDIPRDARRGYFLGLDGRRVLLPGETQRDKEHLCMSGYLQNGEAIIIKRAAIITDTKLFELKKLRQWMFVDIVHDELQSETKNSMDIAMKVAKIKADAIREAGEYYKLHCPMAGSYWNDDHKDFTIGTNWYATH